MIVSESVARQLWPNEDAIGKRISTADHPKSGDWLTVVGVVDDVRQQRLTKNPTGAIYQPYLQVSHPFFLSHVDFVLRAASSPQSVASEMREALREVDRNQPVQSIALMQEIVAATTTEHQQV